MTTTLKLRPYQTEAKDWIKQKKRGLLALGMRLGKTAVTIKAAEELGLKKILIVCPSIARITWQREFEKWGSPRKTHLVTKRAETPKSDVEVFICSFDYATQRFEKLKETEWDLLIVDESHYLKSLTAKRTIAILSQKGLIHKSKRTWFLTGTPMPNHPFELWPMLYTFGATTLSQDQFIKKFCHSYSYLGRTVVSGTNIKALGELRSVLKPIMHRKTMEDVVSDMPAIQFTGMPIEADLDNLTPELKDQFVRLSAAISWPSALSPLQQIQALEIAAESVSSLRRYCAIQKVKAISAIVGEELEIKAYDKIVIFGVHREALETLALNLKAFKPSLIYGGMSPALRQRNIDNFRNESDCRVIICNIQTASTNIDLSTADQVLFLEQSWVPGDNSQAIARVVSVEKKKSIYVRAAEIANTVDEKVQEILLRKTKEIAALLNG